MSFIQQFQNISGTTPISRRRALIGLSLFSLAACSRSGEPGTADTDNKIAYYTCTMHPFVRSQDSNGKCPVCGMNLVAVLKSSANVTPIAFIAQERLKEIGAKAEAVTVKIGHNSISVPVDAVLPTGSKSIVFIDHGDGQIEPREIKIGAQTASFCEVISGLQKEDRVFVSAIFLIDAECRIQGVLKTYGDRP